jgi:4-hydroxy-3-polyprenylbenzoate decarboxylase
MAFASLRDFLQELDRLGQFRRIGEPVSLVHEMTEIQRRVAETGGPALLFEAPIDAKGRRMDVPVLANLYGTVERVALGLGRRPDALEGLGEELAELSRPAALDSLAEVAARLPMAGRILAMTPRRVSRAPVHDIVLTGKAVDLAKLPIQTFWPGEGGPLITWGIVVTKGPGRAPEDDYNLACYRMQVLDRNRTIMRWLPQRGGAQHFRRWRAERKGPMPVAVVLGADPAVTLAAVTPVPESLSEYAFAGLIGGKKAVLVPCRTIPLLVPASAEIVLEGHVLPDETALEGPFVDHTGYLNSVERFPVFVASAITMRRRPIYPSTFLGRPPDEASTISRALNDVFVPLIRRQFPEIVDFWLPPEACSYRIAVVSIRKAYPGHARRMMLGAWSALRQFAYTKIVIVVDDDIDARSWRDVMWALATRMDPGRDLVILDRTPIDYLDFASPVSGLGGKLGIDATRKIPPETDRRWGEVPVMPETVRADALRKLADWGLAPAADVRPAFPARRPSRKRGG